jgi:PIN domain nuclease of toxin-antitoxin system
MATEPERLGSALREIDKQANGLFLSAASTWKLASKVSIDRLEASRGLQDLPDKLLITR